MHYPYKPSIHMSGLWRWKHWNMVTPWWFSSWPYHVTVKMETSINYSYISSIYPLVNIQKTMENHHFIHFSWENSLFRLGHGFNSFFVCLPEGTINHRIQPLRQLNAIDWETPSCENAGVPATWCSNFSASSSASRACARFSAAVRVSGLVAWRGQKGEHRKSHRYV